MADKESCSSFEDLGRLSGLGEGDCSGFGGHALFSNEISRVNDDVSCSLRMNQRKCFLKEKQLLTLQRKTTHKRAEVSRDTTKRHENRW